MKIGSRPLRMFFLLTALISGGTARGAALAGVSLPDHIVVGGARLVLNGIGLREKTIFNVKVYVAGLYLKAISENDAEILRSAEPKELVIVFMRDVEGKAIADSWDEGFENNCKKGCEALAERLAKLKAAMTDVKKNQRIRIVFTAKDITVATAGAKPARFEGKDFGDMVLSTFIGEAPTQKLKDGLLGKLGRPNTDVVADPTALR